MVFVLTAGALLSAGLSAAMAGTATQSMAAIPVAAANCNIKRELLVIGLRLLYSASSNYVQICLRKLAICRPKANANDGVAAGARAVSYFPSNVVTGFQSGPGGWLTNALARLRNNADGLSTSAARAKHFAAASNSRRRHCARPSA
jgi:hypothetical protein